MIKNGDNKIRDIKLKMIDDLENQLEKLEKRQEELYDLLEDKIYTKEIFLKRNKKLALERKELKLKIKSAKEDAPKFNYEDKIMQFKDVIRALKDPNISAKNKNTLLKSVIERIDYMRKSENRSKWDTSKPELDIHLKDF